MNKSEHNEELVHNIIRMLQEMNVDGETMEYIIREVGMDEQMLSQLGMKATQTQMGILLECRKYFGLPL